MKTLFYTSSLVVLFTIGTFGEAIAQINNDEAAIVQNTWGASKAELVTRYLDLSQVINPNFIQSMEYSTSNNTA